MFDFLKNLGFNKAICKKCNMHYWRYVNDEYCGECSNVTKEEYVRDYNPISLDLHKLKKKYINHFKGIGYTVMSDRSLKTSRNNVNYMLAGISGYAPAFTKHLFYNNFVKINGNPYSVNKFVNLQTCVRFNDCENVGVTNIHATNFIMAGQHIFENHMFLLNLHGVKMHLMI